MAKKNAPPENVDERDRPLRTMIALVVGFLVIVGIATWTVLVPEIADDAGEEDEGRGSEQPEAAPPIAEAPPST
jgi:hypothetical protein